MSSVDKIDFATFRGFANLMKGFKGDEVKQIHKPTIREALPYIQQIRFDGVDFNLMQTWARAAMRVSQCQNELAPFCICD